MPKITHVKGIEVTIQEHGYKGIVRNDYVSGHTKNEVLDHLKYKESQIKERLDLYNKDLDSINNAVKLVKEYKE